MISRNNNRRVMIDPNYISYMLEYYISYEYAINRNGFRTKIWSPQDEEALPVCTVSIKDRVASITIEIDST